MHVETVGSGPRLVLVHGSGGTSGWPAQRPLAGAVLPGAGHSLPRAAGFNERLVELLSRA